MQLVQCSYIKYQPVVTTEHRLLVSMTHSYLRVPPNVLLKLWACVPTAAVRRSCVSSVLSMNRSNDRWTSRWCSSQSIHVARYVPVGYGPFVSGACTKPIEHCGREFCSRSVHWSSSMFDVLYEIGCLAVFSFCSPRLSEQRFRVSKGNGTNLVLEP
jgi:hypothetical protein